MEDASASPLLSLGHADENVFGKEFCYWAWMSGNLLGLLDRTDVGT